MSSRLFYTLIIACLLLSISLSVWLVGGRAERSIFGLIEQTTETRSKLIASNLELLIGARTAIIKDLAETPAFASSVMGSIHSKSNLEDLFDDFKILGKKEPLLLFDVLGDLVYSNQAGFSDFDVEEKDWFNSLIDNEAEIVVSSYPFDGKLRLMVAAPVKYNNLAEGALVVIVSSDLDSIFNSVVDDGVLSVELSGKYLNYQTANKNDEYQSIFKDSISGTGLAVEYFADRERLVGEKRGFMRDIAIAIVSSLAIAFGVLLVVARQLILNPFRQLETSQKETKEALDQVDLLAQAIDASPVGITIGDARKPGFPLNYVNQKFLEMADSSTEDLIGKGCSFLQGEETDLEKVAEIRRALNNKESLNIEIINYSKTGKMFWNNLYLSPIYGADGQLVAYVGIQEDITRRKEEQRVLEESNTIITKTLLELKEQKFAMDQHAMVAVTDVKGVITFVNDKFSQISGYEKHELLGRNHRLLNSGTHDIDFFKTMYRTIASGEVWHGEICNRNKNGTLYWVDTTIVPFKGDTGKPQSYIAIRTDITELKAARDDAQAAAKAKSEFLANMSHEIRTPMNGVLGMLSMLEKTELDSDQNKKLQVAKGSAKSLLTLLNDILDFSKIEAGKLDLEYLPFNVEMLFSECVDTLRFLIDEGKNVDLILDLGNVNKPLVVGDSNRLRQVTTNLIGNAIKFTSQGAITVKVRTENAENGQCRLFCSVRDTGVGIPQDKLASLFEDFNQADASTTRKYGGTGLGLSISKKLCELMGGSIRVESSEGKGSCFEFDILVGECVEQYQSKSEMDCRLEVSDATNLKGVRVLLVEDNEVNQFVASGMLEDLGMKVDIANNGKEALDLLAKCSEQSLYAVVLMDCQMPVMDGYTATRELRSGSAGSLVTALPIVAMTANAMKGDRENCIAAGMNDYLTKPIEPEELQAALEKWVSHSHVGDAKLRPSSDGSSHLMVWNTASALKRCRNKDGRLRQLIESCIDTLTQELLRLSASIEDGDIEGAKRIAHLIKGVAGNVSAEQLHAAVMQLELKLKASESIPTIRESLEIVKTSWVAALAQFKKYL